MPVPMPVFICSAQPLSQADIFNMLTELRSNRAVAPLSGYLVSTITLVKRDGLYYYCSGVNIEYEGQRLRHTLHGEQTALANTLALLGGDTKILEMYIMAAHINDKPDPEQKSGKSCGHCRQVTISLAEAGAKIYVVTLDGRFSMPDSFEGENPFLPDPFSERDFPPSFPPQDAQESPAVEPAPVDLPQPQVFDMLNGASSLTPDEIKECLRLLKPHIINENFNTSPITACIVECHNDEVEKFYVAGVLLQDIAFLDTGPLDGAIGSAITQRGIKGLCFDAIHAASNSLDPAQLTLTEIETLSNRYAHAGTNVHFYMFHNNQYACYPFKECVRARTEAVYQRLEHNSPLAPKDTPSENQPVQSSSASSVLRENTVATTPSEKEPRARRLLFSTFDNSQEFKASDNPPVVTREKSATNLGNAY